MKYVVLIAFVIGFIFSHMRFWSANTLRALEYKQEIPILRDIFVKKGSMDGYKAIVARYAQDDPVAVHDILHWVGSELYGREGIDGLSICDSSFNWGCYHGFLGRAFVKEGKGFIGKIETVCQRVSTKRYELNGCLHGIGHGMLTLAGGYDGVHLSQALSDCDLLTTNIGKTTCYNGVFMEYNMRTMEGVDEGQHALRVLDPARPLAPCDELPFLYQSDCYYEQADWWRMVTNRDWKTMGEYCGRIADPTVAESCFRGVGRGIWGESKFTSDVAVKNCQLMPGVDAQGWCIDVTVEELVRQENARGKAHAICQSLPTSSQATCFSRLEEAICEAPLGCKP